MSNLKKQYEEIIEQRKIIVLEMKQLEENDAVKKYLELKKQRDSLYERDFILYKEIKFEEYKYCQHILVYSKIEHGNRSCGCIKCGLDNSILDYKREWLTFNKQVMYDYLRGKYLRGKETKIACNLDLAQAIYSKLKESYPDIDDETVVKYFGSALDNIRNIKVSDERKKNRARRLSLNTNFENWNGSDVYSS